MDWKAAAKGNRSHLLPVSGEEYLALDVVAFEPAGDRRWRFPVAVFELENHRTDDRVAYSLWKVLCLRSALRVVFAFRRDWEASRQTVGEVCDAVVRSMPTADRAGLAGGEGLPDRQPCGSE